ncbi:MAG TPA: hypothetical protein VM940_12685 [Chthoniobacterales bacterium]|jgi:hypothetical protein|nr:hypothetical protein [Chthoniobacterales bacterium]
MQMPPTINNASKKHRALVRLGFLAGLAVVMTGCAEEPVFPDERGQAPVAGEATPAPAQGARTGWAW